ncbi:universal stress family protein [[Clostridium] sordellii ATCC 9714]|uniref:Universal stress protein A (UspA) n=1 Tax=Paraclostridium sordellii TaxID=1505 RepID=A0ABM9RUC7_PARSO|nr:universal stress protein [Paeniclostridium sordellii]EPZ62075.1 universal stress family protein [[Clostridium] sordellii ATCC 9714] [Paeniclostridium sordellii ATCC 9714]TAN66150.1 universal stress protein [Paeniclostridium sordellii 8483]CEJ75516.1 putative universal stress protein A (UspA) (plasmid) [[Clostridium] sordellii] [Paeniclostridium sordellii]CEN22474.1 universal stress protein [[Clostridium] sordellii] [Paeniclostridium sordellii]CEN29721.1 universal stress protein [[Clostridiu
MKKILVPIDGSERSQKSLDFIKQNFSKDDVEIMLMNVSDISLTNITNKMLIDKKIEECKKEINIILDKIKNDLQGYNVEKYLTFGDPGNEIISKSINGKFDTIIMTKSTKKNFIDSIGSVTLHVVKKSKCTVIILSE